MSGVRDTVNELDEDIKIVSVSGDWELLYVDGQLKHEDHSITISDVSRYVDGFNAEEEWVNVSVDGASPQTYEELLKLKEVSDAFEVDCEVREESAMFVVKNVNVDVNVSVFRHTPKGCRRYVDNFEGVAPEEGIVVEFDEGEEVEDISVQFNCIYDYSSGE